jgi:sterol desaturase/sphingolipid hydroxylase (fatty acid hydroxylase superfamily)
VIPVALQIAASLGAFAVGALGWSLAEYLLHRFAGHRRRSRWLFTREHLRHHRELDWFSPTWRKALIAGGLLAVAGSGLGWTVGPPGVAGVFGFIGAYLVYERMHRRLHTHPPRGPWGRWARRHHWLHHAVDPASNHGVTSPLWDHVFGTLRRERVLVHRGRAPSWLLDPAGAVRPELVQDYELVAGGSSPTAPR